MRYIKLILLLLILIPLKVNAASLDLNCPSVSTPDSEVTCTIQSSDSLKGIKLLFSLPNEITITKVNTNWTNHYKGTKGLVATKTTTENFSASLTIKISEQAVLGNEYNIGIINIEASDNINKIATIKTPAD